MLEIPPNVMLERMKSFESDQEVPDEWKSVPALSEEQARIYRAKIVLFKFEKEYKYSSIRVEGIIPVYSVDICIGCLGEVDVTGEEVVAELIIDYATPERLELQNNNPNFVVEPVIEADLFEGKICYGSNVLRRVNLKLGDE